ncbi:DNA polymerase III [Acinetobacter baumannii]|uniref:DNA polymerase III n=2 Tax=Acinetobacter baumannii TaxID=470 RepID=UPI00227A21B5|nr:DNA polymerase III [Acinetobacter baumannii]
MNSTYWSILRISGPIPGEFSLLSIGACIVSNPAISIYRELKPISSKHDLEAIAVTGLNLEKLEVDDLDLLMAIVN